MAHIVDFSISGLAGRKEAYHQVLDRHINVFFGLNGSGKTSLLRILNSAMELDSSELINVPFTVAEVNIYSISDECIYTHKLEKKIIRKSKTTNVMDSDSELVMDPFQRTRYKLSDKYDAELPKLPEWKIEPKLPKKINGWAHNYLPTSRLYMGRAINLPPSQFDSTSEDGLNKLFARTLQGIWSDYNNKLIRGINQAQQDGLANILKAVLTGKKNRKVDENTIDIAMAFKRMSKFLQRQGSGNILGTFEKFQLEYSNNLQLQSVVGDINLTELLITDIMAPRTQLESLIRRMFSVNKNVHFGETTIDVMTSRKENIGVDSLSSGEKHVLLLFIEALRIDRSSLLIDEPEISMHIDWQKELISTMHKLNPSAQLIFASHSPDIMADVKDEKIFRL